MKFRMLFPLYVLAADVGRMDPAQLTDQQHMELAIADLSAACKAQFQNESGDFMDICKWGRINVDDEGNVENIFFFGTEGDIEGSINFSFFPPLTRNISVTKTSIIGTVETKGLPRRLVVFNVFSGSLSGTFDMTALPETLRDLRIYEQKFEGELNLTQLPRGLEWLDASKNRFTGSVRLDALPQNLENLDIGFNALSGEIVLEKFPMELRDFVIRDNAFTGVLEVKPLPFQFNTFDASNNSFEEGVVWRRASRKVEISGNPFKKVVDEKGKSYPEDFYA